MNVMRSEWAGKVFPSSDNGGADVRTPLTRVVERATPAAPPLRRARCARLVEAVRVA
jgi:hypothetical protein